MSLKLRWNKHHLDRGPSSQSYGFSSSHIWMWELDYKERWAPKYWCFWTVTARRSNQSILKEILVLNIHWKDWYWSWNSNTLATWCKEPTHWKRPWCWERLRAGGGGEDRRWDGWMASLTWWTWAWVNSRSWWWTGRSGVLQSMGLQTVGHSSATELTEPVYAHQTLLVPIRVTLTLMNPNKKPKWSGHIIDM